MKNAYWLRTWIDEEGIKTLQDAERCMQSSRSVGHLVECAERQSNVRSHGGYEYHGCEFIDTQTPNVRRTIVGGYGLDLSGRSQCMRKRECALRAVDMTVHHTWHSFDQVIVNGLDSHRLMEVYSRRGRLVPDLDVLPHVNVVLYIKETRADELLCFMDRPHAFCQDHYRQALDMTGLAAGLETTVDHLAGELLAGYKLAVLEMNGGTNYLFTHPATGTNLVEIFYPCDEAKRTREAIAQDAAKVVARSYAQSVLLNTALARGLSASLGQLADIDDAELGRLAHQKVSPDEVAYNLLIPIVENLPLKELMALRRDELGEFQAFQAAIRKAVEERLKATPAENAYQVAQSVYDDVIEPALIDMERKIDKAAEIFVKRSVAAVTVGTIMTTVGLLAFPPIAAPGIVIGTSAFLANYHELLKDKREVELSDLHFLWRLSSRAARCA
jgi:hypothetical protein